MTLHADPSAEQPARPATPVHRRGLDASRDALIMDATLSLVGEVGYDNVSMDAIAARAHVSKATIYRRWDSKAEVVAHSMRCRVSEAMPELPDTGDLRQDLLLSLTGMIERVCDEDLALMTGLLTTMRTDPELARLIREQMVAEKRTATQAFIEREVARGRLPSTIDPRVLDEVSSAIIFSRLIITGEPVDAAFVTHLVDDVLMPVLEHSVRPTA
jgi:AcrR family transcriptional regulator